jgi:ubiquinone/menaquinone biosynthesis C-methylase UbiE
MSFQDHFSKQAAEYAAYRPRYPEALYIWLAEQTRTRDVVWDCATGNGQAAHGLVPYFRHIWATDASASQLVRATPHPSIEYRQATAETSGLPNHAVDLITVAQAVHWFDLDAFYTEVQRVLRTGGLLALWTYGLFRTDPPISKIIIAFYHDVVGPYWPVERQLVEEQYRTLEYPFEEIEAPAFQMTNHWSRSQLLGYLHTWSATQRFKQDQGTDPVAQVADDLAQVWGPEGRTHFIEWPIYLRVGYNR